MSSSQVPSTGHGVPDPSRAAHDVAEGLSRVGQSVADQVKPRLRGWIHAGVAPFVLVAAIVLVALAPTDAARWSTAVFGLTAVLLFGTSGGYHRGRWSAG